MHEQLLLLQIQLVDGDVSDEDYVEQEVALFARLWDITGRKRAAQEQEMALEADVESRRSLVIETSSRCLLTPWSARRCAGPQPHEPVADTATPGGTYLLKRQRAIQARGTAEAMAKTIEQAVQAEVVESRTTLAPHADAAALIAP